MALSRRRDSSIIWPGFVDAVTTLLMVLMFLLTIFIIMQSVLQQTIANKNTELDSLSGEITSLSDALGLERRRVAELEVARQGLLDDKTALEALLSQTQETSRDTKQQLDTAQRRLLRMQIARDADAADLMALRERLAQADDARIVIELALEEQRKKAEETLLLLAAAQEGTANNLAAHEKTQAALAIAQQKLTQEQEKTLESAQKLTLMNAQLEVLRQQLAELERVLEASENRDATAKVQIEALGTKLNTALAQVASEQKKRAELEEAERRRLEAENQNLAKFRSSFFAEMSQLLEGQEGVRVVGDRFVFSSEVLFNTASAELSDSGKTQIAKVAQILSRISDKIPPNIDWIIRVDGHTDNVPLSPGGVYSDNWALSQARALSVVRYMQDTLGFDPQRLAATGFGQYRPVVPGDSPAARAQNRRIELKLTER